MEIEPLPKVTFLPAQLTNLVIESWTGDIIDYQKNGQVSTFSITLFRFAKSTTVRALASLRMDIPTRARCAMVCSAEKVSLPGRMGPNTKASSMRTRSLGKASILGQMALVMMAKFSMG